MAQYFENDEKLRHDEKQIDVIINNQHFSFITDSGVFSKTGLDFGTRSLLESLPINKISGDVLDLGCGYGPIGIYIAKLTKSNVDMVDVNLRALDLVKKNQILNHVTVNPINSDGFINILKKYDFIITNPPIRVGKEKLYSLLFEAENHLKDEGELWLVVNKNQGAKSLTSDLKKVYDVTLIAKKKGFHILRCTLKK